MSCSRYWNSINSHITISSRQVTTKRRVTDNLLTNITKYVSKTQYGQAKNKICEFLMSYAPSYT